MARPLNEAQQEIVDYHDGHVIVAAGPGTGKTHTLIARIIRSIERLNPHEHILALTFTNKAAREIEQRLRAASVRLDAVTVGTLHRFCLGILRRYADATPLPKDVKIALPNDINDVTAMLWPDKTQRQRSDILEDISYVKSTELVMQPTADYMAYQKAMRQAGLIDMDDILRETLMLLDTNDEILNELHKQYKSIFIDEYQDINVVQQAIIKILTGRDAVVTAIGDPNQSIYGFRGSDVTLFERFAESFEGAKQFFLTHNYRSTKHIVTASQQVIEKSATGSLSPELTHMAQEGKLTIHGATTDRSEAEYVAHTIEKMLGGLDMRTSHRSQRSFADFAILYRLNAQQHVISGALEHLGIPYQVSKRRNPTSNDDDEALGSYEEELDYNVEKVSLLTLHAAKGLEFPIVFVIGCEDQLIPLDLPSMKGDIEEERRLFFVGMTRAKEELYLTYAKRRQLFGTTHTFEASPFLADIHHDLKAIELARRKKQAPVDNQLKLF